MQLTSIKVKTLLDKFYAEFDFARGVSNDPIEFPHRYEAPLDIEVAAFIASSFAYGRVELFKPVIGSILSKMGQSPSAFLYDFDVERQRNSFEAISYRFNKGKDVCAFLYVIHRVLQQKGSLKAAFLERYNGDVYEMLGNFVQYACEIDTIAVYGDNIHHIGLLQLFPSPFKGSACKRLNMFLRWMVRDKDIDFGLWKELPKSGLIIPLDTHIGRVGRCLGLTTRKSNDWKTAKEITVHLKEFDPDDPIKYDFALCHHGISGSCSPAQCGGCELNAVRESNKGGGSASPQTLPQGDSSP
ncbi:MAG: TIGR02757 family protein [Nitrospirae bacterium]|nr:TIGR02757 family protein [Nitrospirota bacterium]